MAIVCKSKGTCRLYQSWCQKSALLGNCWCLGKACYWTATTAIAAAHPLCFHMKVLLCTPLKNMGWERQGWASPGYLCTIIHLLGFSWHHFIISQSCFGIIILYYFFFVTIKAGLVGMWNEKVWMYVPPCPHPTPFPTYFSLHCQPCPTGGLFVLKKSVVFIFILFIT